MATKQICRALKVRAVQVPIRRAISVVSVVETMGIEGIETAIAAMILYDVPVWATFTEDFF